MDHVDNDTRWDDGELGRDAHHARPVSVEAATLDEAAGLQMISIRLPKELIEHFKFIGDTQGIRYQTLMRQVLARFAESELKQMARDAAAAQIAQTRHEAESVANVR
jgi:uncharacterized protein (DUF4415 family)